MKKVSLKEFGSLIPYLKPFAAQYILGFIVLIIVDGAQILVPQFVRRAIDAISSGNFDVHMVYRLALQVLALAVVISVGRFLWRYFINGSSRRIEAKLRQKLFDHLLTLAYDFYQKTKIGDLMARATNDMGAVRMSISMGFVALIDGTVMSLAILIIMFVQDPVTAFFAVLPLPIISVVILFFGGVVGKLFRRAQETYSNLSDTVQETFAGIRVIKSFAKENWFIKKFAANNADYQAANMLLAKSFGVAFPLVAFLSGITTLVLVFVGGAKVMRGEMTIGKFAAFFSYLNMLIWPIMSLGFMIIMLQRGAASMERINEILNTEPSIKSPEIEGGSLPPAAHFVAPTPPSAGTPRNAPCGNFDIPAISINNLTFTYPVSHNDKPAPQVLSGITIDIAQGMFVGILGKTGTGKTTLLKTLMRLIDPPAHSVFIFGKDVREYNLTELRSLFAMVPQDTYLFSDSVKGNVAYGVENASDDDVREAVDIAAVAKDLDEFPNGWDTVVGERGVTLSGGQKQRTAIARAIIKKDAPIIVLDDALSAVDAETEKRFLTRFLQERKNETASNDLSARRTTIIVSHRVSTLQHADLVLVLEGGTIIESGAPHDLMQSDGFFAQTAKLQRLVSDVRI